MFSCYVFCVCFACIIAGSCSIRLYLHIHHEKTFDGQDKEIERQEVIDTGGYELRRRRRSLDDPQFQPVSADEERAEALDRPSVARFRQVVRDAGLVGGWSVEEQEGKDLAGEEEEDVRKTKREDEEKPEGEKKGRKKQRKEEEDEDDGERTNFKKSRLWTFGQMLSGLIFGKTVANSGPSEYAKWASHYGLYAFVPPMVIITVVHILFWYIWFARRAVAHKPKQGKKGQQAPKGKDDDESDSE